MSSKYPIMQPSCDETAIFAAFARYLGSDDQFSKTLVNALGVPLIVGYPAELVDRVTSGVTLRTLFLDKALDDAMEAGIRQVVILGAGLDTRPWRISWPKNSVIWTVDRPGTATVATEILGVPPSAPLRALTADLEEQEWVNLLIETGFDRQCPTLFIAEALLLYLDISVSRQVLNSIVELSPAGSRFAFTYMGHRLATDTIGGLKRATEALGHGFKSSISSPEEFLGSYRWASVVSQTYGSYAKSLGIEWLADEGGGVSWLCQATLR